MKEIKESSALESPEEIEVFHGMTREDWEMLKEINSVISSAMAIRRRILDKYGNKGGYPK